MSGMKSDTSRHRRPIVACCNQSSCSHTPGLNTGREGIEYRASTEWARERRDIRFDEGLRRHDCVRHRESAKTRSADATCRPSGV